MATDPPSPPFRADLPQAGSDPVTDRRREHKRFSENHYNRAQTLAAWLLATLVAINTSGAGAIVAALKGPDRQPAIAFAAGIVLAVASGISSWIEANAHAGLHYVKSLEEPTDEDLRTQRLAQWEAGLVYLFSPILNVMSLVAFAIGCAWAASVL